MVCVLHMGSFKCSPQSSIESLCSNMYLDVKRRKGAMLFGMLDAIAMAVTTYLGAKYGLFSVISDKKSEVRVCSK